MDERWKGGMDEGVEFIKHCALSIFFVSLSHFCIKHANGFDIIKDF